MHSVSSHLLNAQWTSGESLEGICRERNRPFPSAPKGFAWSTTDDGGLEGPTTSSWCRRLFQPKTLLPLVASSFLGFITSLLINKCLILAMHTQTFYSNYHLMETQISEITSLPLAQKHFTPNEPYWYFSSAPGSIITAGHSARWPWFKLCS